MCVLIYRFRGLQQAARTRGGCGKFEIYLFHLPAGRALLNPRQDPANKARPSKMIPKLDALAGSRDHRSECPFGVTTAWT